MGSKTAARLPKNDATPPSVCAASAPGMSSLSHALAQPSACAFRHRPQIYLHSAMPHLERGTHKLPLSLRSRAIKGTCVFHLTRAPSHNSARVHPDTNHPHCGVMFFARQRMRDTLLRVCHPAPTQSPLRSTAHAHPVAPTERISYAASPSHTSRIQWRCARTAPLTRA